jgi:hypothetical protein
MSWQSAYEYLSSRGEPYGINAMDMINHTPGFIQDNPEAIISFWSEKDISHIIPTSIAPDLAGDPGNWIAEDPGPNRNRQDDEMSDTEEFMAHCDNFVDALLSDLTHLIF